MRTFGVVGIDVAPWGKDSAPRLEHTLECVRRLPGLEPGRGNDWMRAKLMFGYVKSKDVTLQLMTASRRFGEVRRACIELVITPWNFA